MNTKSSILLVLVVLVGACKEDIVNTSDPTKYRLTSIGIEIPKATGWVPDEKLEKPAKNEGGVIFRLVREPQIPGAPRIEVRIEPKDSRATELDVFLAKSLGEMANLEGKGEIRISKSTRKNALVGPRRAYRLYHEYSMGNGGNIVFTQTTLLTVLNGRGISVVASGLTELFRPLSANIDQILDGINTATYSNNQVRKKKSRVREIAPVDDNRSSVIKPIDLEK